MFFEKGFSSSEEESKAGSDFSLSLSFKKLLARYAGDFLGFLIYILSTLGERDRDLEVSGEPPSKILSISAVLGAFIAKPRPRPRPLPRPGR